MKTVSVSRRRFTRGLLSTHRAPALFSAAFLFVACGGTGVATNNSDGTGVGGTDGVGGGASGQAGATGGKGGGAGKGGAATAGKGGVGGSSGSSGSGTGGGSSGSGGSGGGSSGNGTGGGSSGSSGNGTGGGSSGSNGVGGGSSGSSGVGGGSGGSDTGGGAGVGAAAGSAGAGAGGSVGTGGSGKAGGTGNGGFGNTGTGGTAGSSGSNAGSGQGGSSAGSGGSAGCAPTEKPCGGVCVDVADPQFGCAAMGCSPCVVPNATATCSNGLCAVGMCAPGYKDCQAVVPGCETFSDGDVANCGSCGNLCPSALGQSPTCTGGMCGLSACAPPLADCDMNTTCETDTSSNPMHCGSCSKVCTLPNATASCAAGSCEVSACTGGFHDCNAMVADGCESSLVDDSNCGACAVICPGTTHCGTSVDASFATQPAGWGFNGTAYYDPTAQTGVLTQALNGQNGSILYANPVAFTSLTVSFDFRISGGNRADGMAFVLVTDGPNALGNAGGGLGAAGLNGFAVELDIYNNQDCSDVDGNHTGIDQLSPTCNGLPTPLATSPDLFPTVGDIADGTWRTVSVSIAGGGASVTVQGLPVLSGVGLPGFLPTQPYYLGFTGSTGGLNAQQEIRNVQITLPGSTCL